MPPAPSPSAAEKPCPRCRGTTLFALESGAGTRWWCPACEGHWVSHQVEAKLRPLLEAVVAPVSARPREACVSGRHTLQAGQEHCGVCPREALRCPGCARRMRLHALHGVTVDVCTGCPAVWLDAGELAKLRQALVPLSERVRKAGDAAAEAVSDAVTDALTDGVTDALYEPRRSVRALVVLFRVLLGRRW